MIRLESVFKSFAARRVLRGLSLSVEPGEVYGLVGPNGAGKTTALSILCGLLAPDEGTASIAGVPAMAGGRRRLGVVPQEVALYDRLTCRENLRLFAELHGLDRRRTRARVAAVIAELGLEEYSDTPVAALSGGWRRRVNVGVAVVHAPAALVLDEPTAGLDVAARHELWALIERLRAGGTAILVTTHDLDEAERVCSRLGVLGCGRVVAEGTMDELRAAFPAALLAEVTAAGDEAALGARAAALGWPVRCWRGRLTLLVPERLGFDAAVAALDGCGLSALRLREVGLEQIFLEMTAGSDQPSDLSDVQSAEGLR